MKKKFIKLIVVTYVLLILISFFVAKSNNPRYFLYLFLSASIISTMSYILDDKKNWIVIGFGVLTSLILVIIIF